MKKILLILLAFNILSCSGQDPFVGEWHAKKEEAMDKFFTDFQIKKEKDKYFMVFDKGTKSEEEYILTKNSDTLNTPQEWGEKSFKIYFLENGKLFINGKSIKLEFEKANSSDKPSVNINSESPDDNMLKSDLVNILSALKTNDTQSLYKYLPTSSVLEEAIMSIDSTQFKPNKNIGYHLIVSHSEFIQYIKNNVNATPSEWNNAIPSFILVEDKITNKDVEIENLNFIFGIGTSCYEQRLQRIKYQNKVYYNLKKDVRRLDTYCGQEKFNLKKNIQELKENNIKEYNRIKFIEY